MPQKDLDKAANKRKSTLRGLFSASSSNSERRKVILTTICGLMVIVLATSIANLQSSKAFAHTDSIAGQGVGIFWDQSGTNKTLTINWANIQPGSNRTITLYVKNEDNSAIYLGMTTQNWAPSNALDYMNLTWNYNNQVLTANQMLPIELTLSVSQNITNITQFSFSTTITSIA